MMYDSYVNTYLVQILRCTPSGRVVVARVREVDTIELAVSIAQSWRKEFGDVKIRIQQINNIVGWE